MSLDESTNGIVIYF